jgi:hypothetical protein
VILTRIGRRPYPRPMPENVLVKSEMV